MDRILSIFIMIFLGYITITLSERVDHYKGFEYHLILEGDDIVIESDLGQRDTIPADSLNTYLLWDNL